MVRQHDEERLSALNAQSETANQERLMGTCHLSLVKYFEAVKLDEEYVHVVVRKTPDELKQEAVIS